MLAENKKQICKMNITDDDLDGETKDLFVTIDNPEKHHDHHGIIYHFQNHNKGMNTTNKSLDLQFVKIFASTNV